MRVGIDIGGSHTSVGIINENFEIIEQFEKEYTIEEKKSILQVIEKFVISTVNNIKDKYDLEFIGIAIPGSVANGVISKAVNLGIENYNISQTIQNATGLPVKLINDAKSACVAEYNVIAKKEPEIKNMLFLAIGTGIGGGVIYNGKLLTGTKYDGYELGHMVIKENGLQCKCGKRGCFERYGSILEYKNKVKKRLNIAQEINAQPLRDIMNPRAAEIEDLRQEYLDNLALGISNLITIFEPDCVVLGGGFTHFAYMFMDDLKQKIVNSNLLFNKREDIDLRVAQLQNDAGMIGAII